MFSVERRSAVREALLARARTEGSIVGAAITGSAARGGEDRWSDIDLFLGVEGSVPEALASWSDHVYARFGALHHFDLTAGSWCYRAFLLPDLLEVDLGFAPAGEFGPSGGQAFAVVFGTPAAAPGPVAGPDPGHLIGLAWHHALHARTSIGRGNPWQAEYWISALRDHVLTLAAMRLGYPTHYAKGADRLPGEITEPVREALVRTLEAAELTRALGAATRAFVTELHATDPELAGTLGPVLLG
jgi:hypothetical protein